MKEIQLSVNIAENDFNTKLNKCIKLLKKKHQVYLSLQLKGREKAKYCAVDDMDLSALGDDHFVQCTRSREGIKQTGIKEKIIKRLL